MLAEYRRADYNQSWDYGLDLKNFHKASHPAPIFPVLVATEAGPVREQAWLPTTRGRSAPSHSMQHRRAAVLSDQPRGLALARGEPLDGVAWGVSAYEPSPTIIEAAQALYAEHSVEAIARSDAGARNLGETSAAGEQ